MVEISSLEDLIAVLTRLVSQLEAKAIQDSALTDISMKQIYYLDVISKMEKPTFSDLAKQLDVSKPSVTAIVGKLVHRGYVRKVQSEVDRRVYFITLTEKGRALSLSHQNLHREFARYFSQALDEKEANQLITLVNKVMQVVQA